MFVVKLQRLKVNKQNIRDTNTAGNIKPKVKNNSHYHFPIEHKKHWNMSWGFLFDHIIICVEHMAGMLTI